MIGVGGRELLGAKPARQFTFVEGTVVIGIEFREQVRGGLLHLREVKRPVIIRVEHLDRTGVTGRGESQRTHLSARHGSQCQKNGPARYHG